MKATVEIVKITPKQAEVLLNSQVKEQRSLRDAHVSNLARDMREGNFRLSADALVIIKGNLANGQHRMWAVIESNTTQSFLMMDTDDDELYKVLDCGLKRSVGDAANVCNSLNISAIATLVVGYKDNALTQLGFTRRPSRIDLIEFIQKHIQDLQFASQTISTLTKKNANLSPKSVGSALIFLAMPMYGEKVLEFLNGVYSGNMPETSANDLRERFIKMRLQKAQHPSQYYLALMIKAFNSYSQGTRNSQLRMQDSESYPKIAKPAKT